MRAGFGSFAHFMVIAAQIIPLGPVAPIKCKASPTQMCPRQRLPVVPCDMEKVYTATFAIWGCATGRRCCRIIYVGEALRWVYSKSRHVAIATPEKERLSIAPYFSLWDRVKGDFGPFQRQAPLRNKVKSMWQYSLQIKNFISKP